LVSWARNCIGGTRVFFIQAFKKNPASAQALGLRRFDKRAGLLQSVRPPRTTILSYRPCLRQPGAGALAFVCRNEVLEEMNAVIAAVGVMLVLSLSRVHVVIALIIGALTGGLVGGLGIEGTLQAFNTGLGGGATVALSYALLGAFAVAIAKSGLAHALADRALAMFDRQGQAEGGKVKWLLIGLLLVVSVASQNILPIHIAFIPLLVPPLLYVLTRLRIDRRMIACVITFGLITPYIFLPVGFGHIFLNQILLANVSRAGVDVSGINVTHAMALPAAGMLFGLLVAVFVSYRRKRDYDLARIEQVEQVSVQYNPLTLLVAGLAILAAFVVQLWLDSMIIGALVGFLIFSVVGVAC